MVRLGVGVALALVASVGWSRERLGPVDTLLAAPGDLAFAVQFENESGGDQLRLQGTVTATSATAVEVHHGACALHVRLYAAPDRTGSVAWDSKRDRRYYKGTGGAVALVVCPDVLYMSRVSRSQPLATAEMRLSADQLPDTVPDGTYYASASIILDAPQLESSEMPAGLLVVRRQ
jgi:hypothetical protein